MRSVLTVLCLLIAAVFLWAALPATDNFNRADETPLGGNWTNIQQTMALSSNAARAGAGGNCAARWNADTFADDQYSQFVNAVTSADTFVGAAVRMASGSANYYDVQGSNGSFHLRRVSSGNSTNLDSVNIPFVAGDVLRLEVTGTSLVAKKNGVQILSATDSNHTSGSAGISGFNSGPNKLDDWEGGNMGAAAPTIMRRKPLMLFWLNPAAAWGVQ